VIVRRTKTPSELAFDAKYRENPRAIAKYLNHALSTRNPVHILKAIGDMVRAQGVAGFSQKTGLERTSLYRSFKGELRTPFEKVLHVLAALDIQLIAKPPVIAKPPAGFSSDMVESKNKKQGS
jgi:probable addiction module antidote protein